MSMKIGGPVFRQMAEDAPDYVSSDCPIAGRRIAEGIDKAAQEEPGRVTSDGEGTPTARRAHPLTLMCIAYGLGD
jgi:hypothetical protein